MASSHDCHWRIRQGSIYYTICKPMICSFRIVHTIPADYYRRIFARTSRHFTAIYITFVSTPDIVPDSMISAAYLKRVPKSCKKKDALSLKKAISFCPISSVNSALTKSFGFGSLFVTDFFFTEIQGIDYDQRERADTIFKPRFSGPHDGCTSCCKVCTVPVTGSY